MRADLRPRVFAIRLFSSFLVPTDPGDSDADFGLNPLLRRENHPNAVSK